MKHKLKTAVIDMLYYIIGSAFYAIAVTVFISANEISPGGVTGIATVLNYLFGLPVGIVFYILNIPILILGLIKFGGIFIVKTTIATTVVSLFLELSEAFLPAFRTDKILASVFGGIMSGLGLSLVMLRGATTGGVDIIAKIINHHFQHMTVGRILLFTDAIVVLISAVVYKNVASALYSVISLYAASKIMDLVLYGSDHGKIIYIVTLESDTIAKQIIDAVRRGVTVLDVTGSYTGEKKKMLMCAVRRNEVSYIYRIVKECDEKAFIITGEAGEIMGEGFKSIK